MEHGSDVELKPEGPRWWRFLVEAAGLIAIPSVVLYGLGLIVFWLRITLEYSSVSISTTWYAASLVPTSTAAASGIGAICRGLMFGTLIGALLLIILNLGMFGHSRLTESEKVPFFRVEFILPVSVLLSVAMEMFLLIGYFVNGYGIVFAIFMVVFTVAYIAAVVIFSRSMTPNGLRAKISHIVSHYPRNWFRFIIALTLLAIPVLAVLAPQEPTLSCLWKADSDGEVAEAPVVGTINPDDPSQWTLQGGFLSKRDGAWYVLTESDRLEVIPDDRSIRLVGGDFSIKYAEIGPDGKPMEERVSRRDMKQNISYAAVNDCSSFPSQPTITKIGGLTIEEVPAWYKVDPFTEETTQESMPETTQLD